MKKLLSVLCVLLIMNGVARAANNSSFCLDGTQGGIAIGSTTCPSSGLVVTGGSISIGTTSTGSSLNVYGGVSIGTSYVGTAAPTNGMIIQGLVAIGTTATAGALNVAGTIKTLGYTVSTLPTGTVGMRAYVTDQTTACPSPGGTLTGSGAVTCPVFYNGSAWVGD